jgi:hypothetical protein
MEESTNKKQNINSLPVKMSFSKWSLKRRMVAQKAWERLKVNSRVMQLLRWLKQTY